MTPAGAQGDAPFSAASKEAVLRGRREREQRQLMSMRLLETNSTYVEPEQLVLAPDEEEQLRAGCGGRFACLLPWAARGARLRPQPQPQPERDAAAAGAGANAGAATGAAGGAAATRLPKFMQRTSAHAKLSSALGLMEQRLAQLDERAEVARDRAKMLASVPAKKQEALACLKRAKAVEAQAASLRTTMFNLEVQSDAVEASSLQNEVVSALAQAMSKTKKGTKNLSNRAQDAVDQGAELNDLNVELRDLFSELAPAALEDDDELAAELASLVEEGAAAAQPPPAVAVAQAQPGLSPHALPVAPTTRVSVSATGA